MINLDVSFDNNFWLSRQLLIAAQEIASGDLEREAEVKMGEVGQGFALTHTPVVTGSWASSWAVFVEGDRTFMTIAPTAVNPYSDENPPEYGPDVHGMGGTSPSGHRRDVLNVLVDDFGDQIAEAGGEHMITSILAVLT